MDKTLETSQYGNQKGLSINHYLINMLNKILTELDSKEQKAVIANMYDWKSAFDKQCPKLGIESFEKNGVRASLLPLLKNYLQNRKMIVKWRGRFSTTRNLNGGGPQGGTLGILEYLSQTNGNLNFVEEDSIYKFVDDATVLEIVNLISIGIASYNFRLKVASNIPEHNQFVPAENLKSQNYLNRIQEWSENQQMELNSEKTKIMIFNFSRHLQFTTNMKLLDKDIEVVNQTKLLGTIITSDLKWNANTSELIKRGNARMRILHKIAQFNPPKEDMVHIYKIYIRSVLEQSCQVWHSSLNEQNSEDLERVQKCALKIILPEATYVQAMKHLNL